MPAGRSDGGGGGGGLLAGLAGIIRGIGSTPGPDISDSGGIGGIALDQARDYFGNLPGTQGPYFPDLPPTIPGGSGLGGASPGLPPIVALPPTPTIPGPPIASGPGGPPIQQLPTPGGSGQAPNLDQLQGSVLAAGASRASTASLERRLLNRYLGNLGKYAGRAFGALFETPEQILAKGRDLIPFEKQILRGALPGLGRVLGTLGGILWPSDVDPGVPTDKDEDFLRRWEIGYAKRTQDMIGRPMQVDEFQRQLGEPFEEPPNDGPTSFGRRVLEAVLSPEAKQNLERQLNDIFSSGREQGPPAPPERTYEPTVGGLPGQFGGTPSTTVGGGGQSQTRRALPPNLLRYAGLGALALGLIGAGRRATSSARAPTPTSTPTVPNPLTPFEPLGVPYIQPSATTSNLCKCKPKRRGPQRKCLERGQVNWRTGRYKGKLAGTKCIRWERG
jgi:hypothetical protein